MFHAAEWTYYRYCINKQLGIFFFLQPCLGWIYSWILSVLYMCHMEAAAVNPSTRFTLTSSNSFSQISDWSCHKKSDLYKFLLGYFVCVSISHQCDTDSHSLPVCVCVCMWDRLRCFMQLRVFYVAVCPGCSSLPLCSWVLCLDGGVPVIDGTILLWCSRFNGAWQSKGKQRAPKEATLPPPPLPPLTHTSSFIHVSSFHPLLPLPPLLC